MASTSLRNNPELILLLFQEKYALELVAMVMTKAIALSGVSRLNMAFAFSSQRVQIKTQLITLAPSVEKGDVITSNVI